MLDDGRTWAEMGTGLPAVYVTSLAFDASTGTLLAGTYGRGAYELVLAPPAARPTPPVGPGAPAFGPPGLGAAVASGAGGAAVLIVLVVWLRRRGRARS